MNADFQTGPEPIEMFPRGRALRRLSRIRPREGRDDATPLPPTVLQLDLDATIAVEADLRPPLVQVVSHLPQEKDDPS